MPRGSDGLVLTDQRDVSGGGLNLQTGADLPLAGGHSGGNGGGVQRLIGGVVINQQSLTVIPGEQRSEVRGQTRKEGKTVGKQTHRVGFWDAAWTLSRDGRE